MGMFPNGAKVDIAAIAERMRPVLYAWMNAHVVIYDPKVATAAAYDPLADTGGSSVPGIILDTGPGGAIIQPIRSANNVTFGEQNVGILGIRLQVIRDSGTIKLRSGLRVKVVDGGEDRTLQDYRFTLNEGIDSSFGWGRILEATVVTGG